MADPNTNLEAKTLATSFINGNRSDVVNAIAEQESNLASAALALDVLAEMAARLPDTAYVTVLTDLFRAIDARK